MNDVIHVKHSAIVVPNYDRGDNDKIEKVLSVWNKSYFRFDEIGFYHDEETRTLYLPRGLDLNYVENSFHRPLQMEKVPSAFEPATIRLKVEPKSDIQKKSISYLLGEGGFHYTKKYSQLILDLDTGDGKTYCLIAALSFYRMKSLIITHNDNIKGQWKDSILKMTDLQEEYICNIDGSATIKKLLAAKKLPYKVYLINHRSIQSYAKKHGWSAITELFEKLKIGVKVYDEAHLEFDNLMKTDFFTNVKKTIYLTATFQRSDYREDKVFSLCFKNIPVYGKETRGEKRKHINYLAVLYNSKPDFQTQVFIKGRHGFDKNRFMDYTMEQPIFYNVLLYILNYIGGKEGKILILFTKNSAIDQAYEFIQNEYCGDRTIAKYNSTVSDEDKVRALGADIILSTPKSLGTGSDVPGLRFNIVTEQYSSTTSASQYSGRLREYAPDKNTFHIEMVDVGFPTAVSMYKKRLPVFKKGKAAVTLELKYTDKLLLDQQQNK